MTTYFQQKKKWKKEEDDHDFNFWNFLAAAQNLINLWLFFFLKFEGDEKEKLPGKSCESG